MRTLPKRGIAAKATQRPAGAIVVPRGLTDGPTPVPPNTGPPQAIVDPSQAPPVPDMPTAGATDGLGAGTGGLAVHPSLKAANVAGYEPRHSSKHR